MNKKFDCVEMKHAAAEVLQEKLSQLSVKEELEYWKEQSKKLREKQKEARAKAEVNRE